MSATARLLIVLLGLCVSRLCLVEARDKIYYLAVQEIMWDYAPSGMNLITNNRLEDEPISRIYISDMYIGKKYKKAVYRAYTDDTYQTPLPHDPNLGFMGPTLRAEVGDNIIIHFFNNGSRPFSLHPHGVFYDKASEGALYGDNSTEKVDDQVPSGSRYTYTWIAETEYGPTSDDANCLTWAYHSHTNSPVDINSGLIGAMIVCRPGTYREDETRTDVDHEFVALFFIQDETDSWYFWENLRNIPNWETVDIHDEYFIKANMIHVINAYMYGNTPGYDVCQGDTISWHVMGMGSDEDLHPIQFQGQTVTRQHHRKDSLILIPATFSTLMMTANNPGRWFIACKLYSHFTEGMRAWLTVDPACRSPEAPPLPSESLTGQTREYFIAAEEILWDYGPSGRNRFTNQSLVEPGSDSELFFETGPERIGGIYEKAVFRGYTDATFTIPSDRTEDLGILGPPIIAEIGDTIRIVFKNTASNRAYNVEPHGVYYQESYAVPPNSQHTYTWTLPDDVAPSDTDRNCLTYLYTSSVSYIADTSSGLIGPLVICKRGSMEAEMAKPQKYIMLTLFDETQSWYFENNLNLFLDDSTSVDTKDGDFQESNLMTNINGLMFGNLEIDLCVDRDTTLHLLSVGTKYDDHGLTLEGINIRTDGVNTGSAALFPHTSHSISVRPEFTGSGRILCRTISHLINGMTALYTSKKCAADTDTHTVPQHVSPPSRTYYIAAEETIWDYNPRGLNTEGQSVDLPGNLGYFHSHHEPGTSIGSRYKKALYFEYTDETFTTRKSKPAYLGILGPVIKGEVGETIAVKFKNKANRPYNMFPWGAVDPSANSATYEPVQPGETKDYVWQIPESASPTEDQPICQSFIYSSNVDAALDPTDGLLGPLLVCREGGIDEPGVDQEFFLMFHNINENLGHYLDDSIGEILGTDPSSFDKTITFYESNKMKSINGFLYHVEDISMYQNDLVRWHLIGWGNEKDYHSIHFHAHTFLHVSDSVHRGDVFDVIPGFLGTVEMQVIEVGIWLLHCHVSGHILSGMETTYSVLDRNSSHAGSVDEEANQICELIIRDDLSEEYNCDGMGITRLSDFVKNGYLSFIMPNGISASVNISTVQILILSHNRVSTFRARRIIRSFPNLIELNLNNNDLTTIPPGFLANAPLVHILKVRHNPRLLEVSKVLITGNRRLAQRDFTVLDLSENWHLHPPCLNQIFTDMESFVTCFDYTH